jgi:O-antigen ligase
LAQAVLGALLITAALTVPSHAQQQLPHPNPVTAEGTYAPLKWAILPFALAGVLPLAAWLRKYPSIASPIWVLMGLLPFAQSAIPHSNFALISWADWPGFVKGAELSVLDLVALAVYLSLPRARHPLPFRMAMLFYFVAVLLSSLQAEEPAAAMFYAWQLARTFLVYAVVAKASVNERFVPSLLTGLAVGLCFEACVVVWQRFALDVLQPAGLFGTQNALGLVSHFVVFPLLATLLGGFRRGMILALATALSGAVIAVLGASRATIGLAGFGYVVLFSLSTLRRWTQWKAVVGLAGVVAIALLAILALSSLERRFAAVGLGRYDERAAFEAAAANILADHPLGIGANNYANFAITEGYSRAAQVVTIDPALSPHVHNIYLLTAAETGYLGLIAFVLLLLRPLTVAFICAWRNREDPRGELLVGLGTALLIVYIHSAFEWITLTIEVQYVFAMTVGLVAGLAQQMGYWERAGFTRKRSVLLSWRIRRKRRGAEGYVLPDPTSSRASR